jgi:hypothetical protein
VDIPTVFYLDFIKGFSSRDGYSVILQNGETVEVSRRYVKGKLLQEIIGKGCLKRTHGIYSFSIHVSFRPENGGVVDRAVS